MIDIMVENSIGRESSIAPQRFASFMIAFRDFLAHPILGLGGNAESAGQSGQAQTYQPLPVSETSLLNTDWLASSSLSLLHISHLLFMPDLQL